MKTFLFNFKQQFVPLVESGAKLQTIRQTRKDKRRPAVGDIAALYTGLRSSKTRLLRSAPVVRCQSVRLHIDESYIVVDGHRLTLAEAHRFAKADGFSYAGQMLDWFYDQYHEDVFEGFVTEWESQP